MSCQNHKRIEDKIHSLVGSTIYLPDTLYQICDDSYLTNTNYNNFLKITTFINADCGSCLEEIQIWEEFKKTIDTSKVDFFVYLGTNDIYYFKNVIAPKFHHIEDLFLDINFVYLSKNNLENIGHYNTFLLDAQNKIVLVGNPSKNNEVKKLYQDVINNYYKTE